MSGSATGKRVLLINPNTEKAPYPVVPVGLCLVAAALEPRYEVRIWDGTFVGTSGLERLIRDFSPHYVGLGIRNIDDVTAGTARYYIDELVTQFIPIVRAATNAPLILGGAGFNLFPEALLKETGAQFGIVGEGEHAFSALLKILDEGGDPTTLKGVIGPNIPANQARTASDRRLTVPFASADLRIDFSPYRERGAYPIQTKRGCKLRCVYCAYPLIEGTDYRLRPPVDIVDEMAAAADRLGPVVFEFVDSTFNAPLRHAEAVCREIIRRGLKVRLRSMGINPGRITAPLLQLIKDAGFSQVVCSADTAAPSTLRAYRKGFGLKKLTSAASLLRTYDMPTMWSFIFGGPNETEETVAQSFEFIAQYVHPLDMVYMTEGIRIYPHTPIFDIALREGIVTEHTDLLRPVFYVSPRLGKRRLDEIISKKSAELPNCIRAAESDPGPQRLARAAALRAKNGLTEPMFRTLLRIRREEMGLGPLSCVST